MLDVSVNLQSFSLQVNALGPALHTLLLLPTIVNTAKKYSVLPRIVVVSSGLIFWSTIKSDVISAPSSLQVLSSKEQFGPR